MGVGGGGAAFHFFNFFENLSDCIPIEIDRSFFFVPNPNKSTKNLKKKNRWVLLNPRWVHIQLFSNEKLLDCSRLIFIKFEFFHSKKKLFFNTNIEKTDWKDSPTFQSIIFCEIGRKLQWNKMFELNSFFVQKLVQKSKISLSLRWNSMNFHQYSLSLRWNSLKILAKKQSCRD